MSGFNHDTRWTYTRNPENTRWIIDSAPAHAIACTAGYGCDDEDIARLIAEAPMLLAELRAAKGYMLNARFDLETGTKAAGIVTINGGIKRIDAAIAKATGK
jgi:hypothetical protein